MFVTLVTHIYGSYHGTYILHFSHKQKDSEEVESNPMISLLLVGSPSHQKQKDSAELKSNPMIYFLLVGSLSHSNNVFVCIPQDSGITNPNVQWPEAIKRPVKQVDFDNASSKSM